MKRIIVTGDIFRLSSGWIGNQDLNVGWLHELLRAALREATGLPVDKISASAFPGTTIEALYDAACLPLSSAGWAAFAGSVPEPVRPALHAAFEDALIIGFELTPGLRSFLCGAGIPVIEILNHPLRFFSDHLFGMRSDLPGVREGLAAYGVEERTARTLAGVMRAWAVRQPGIRIPEQSVLFLGQGENVVLRSPGGAPLSTRDAANHIERMLAPLGKLLVKRHPLAAYDPIVELLASRGAVDCPDVSVYQLFADDRVSLVCSISSSGCHEAGYFGKRTLQLSGDAARLAWPEAKDTHRDGYWGIDVSILIPDFWRNVLAGVTDVTAEDNWRPPLRSNLIRNSLGICWSYGAFDPGARVPEPPLLALKKSVKAQGRQITARLRKSVGEFLRAG